MDKIERGEQGIDFYILVLEFYKVLTTERSSMKNMKIRAKLLLGFGVVIVLSAVLSVFAIFSLNRVTGNYQDVIDYSQQRLQLILDVKYSVMNIRRITTAINAYCGDVARQEGYKTESSSVCAEIYDNADTYIELAQRDNALSQGNKDNLMEKVSSLKSTMAQYKKDLIDPNIESAIIDDKESIVSNAAAQAPLISALQDIITELVNLEREVTRAQAGQVMVDARFYQMIFIIIAVFTILVSLGFAFVLSNFISKPLSMMTKALDQIGRRGDLQLTPEMAESAADCSRWKDEIGVCARAVEGLIGHLVDVENDLVRVANGDLTVTVNKLSDRDNIGMSVSELVDNLNRMFGEINSSTAQVSIGSKQIANGAQALALASTKQASVIEQLSDSIADVAKKTKDNAERADKAVGLASAIMSNAEKGNRQMGEMMDAVKEINEASQSINKVIKVIDDIAFQTNILALNAAVEAARAGQHGKGFAVVAEEVRNLAAKSAEAAKDTDILIANSMEKAVLGARIADETATSLHEIVSGINESTQLINDIAKYSDEQSAGISQINTGIDEVAQVVQQNSAAAEESAASSEEMSGQSDMLQNIVAQFRLKDGGFGRFQDLSFADKGVHETLALPHNGETAMDYDKYTAVS